jgi:hypothetical protein
MNFIESNQEIKNIPFKIKAKAREILFLTAHLHHLSDKVLSEKRLKKLNQIEKHQFLEYKIKTNQVLTIESVNINFFHNQFSYSKLKRRERRYNASIVPKL